MSFESKVLTLYYTDPGSSKDKQYDVHMEQSGSGYIVYGMNGRRGRANTRQLKTPAPVSEFKATDIFNGLVRDKGDKGYTTSVSGKPFDGVNWGMVVVKASKSEREAISVMHWQSTLAIPDINTLLDHSDIGIQQSPFGRRCLARFASHESLCFTVDDREDFNLTPAVVTEMRTHLNGYFLDGCFDGADFLIVDGYHLAESSGLSASRPFAQRIQLLDQTLKAAGAKSLKVCRAFDDEAEKFQALCQFEGNGEIQILLRRMSSGYVGDKPATPGEAGAFVHTLI